MNCPEIPVNPRTSETHLLQIAEIESPAGGFIGMTFCPGKRDPGAMTGPWDRDLLTDLKVVSAWRTRVLITLMEDHELVQLGVPAIGETTRSLGMTWYHLPIRDVSVPDSYFEIAWKRAGAELRQRLIAGARIVIHCKGGLGRTGLIAARLLIELGESPGRALRHVRKERPGAVETREQEDYVLRKVPALLAMRSSSGK